MSLGRSFPAGFLRAQLKRQLAPGVVFKMNARMDDGRIKEKRFVLVSADSEAITCVINTQLTTFTLRTPTLLICQVAMPRADHPFMSHDSQVDCSAVRRYPIEDVISELLGHPDWILGSASDDLKHQMVSALKRSTQISPSDVAVFCEALIPSDPS